MDSATPSGRGKCKHNVTGKVCRCQEWFPSLADESLCECCEHHMSFHEPLHPIASGYGRCVKEYDDARFSHEDGCQEFFPSCVSRSRTCAGCGCHRSYHEKVPVGVGELAGPSNVHLQEQDSVIGDPSTCLVQSSSKRMRLDPTIIPTETDSEHERASGSVDDVKSESDLADLEPKHKVFLSHSGAQKDFVEQLCIDLERCDRYPFFDRRRRSLPVGMEVPSRLFGAIQQIEVGVVVLSEEFFSRTKWPMLELVEMVRVLKRREPRMNIVPVFLRISREEFCNSERRELWIEKWEEWAKTDTRIQVKKWKLALKIIRRLSSLSLKDGEVSLRKDVVDAVCELVPPESRWDDSNVEGKDRLCKVISEKLRLEVKDGRVRVVGLYGVGGIGKTTICKVLCNELFKKFGGRVCHTELQSASEVQLLRNALKILTYTRHDDLERMDMDKCKDQLRRCIVKQPIFLAIDNVDGNSAELAKTYLGAKDSFGTGSVVVVTSRSLGELKALNIQEDDCFGMPELELHEAKELFRNSAKSIGHVLHELDEDMIENCVKMCLFKKDGESSHYHPLSLKVLGNVVREEMTLENFDRTRWKKRFSGFEESYKVFEFKKQIFSVLRISYDTLSPDDQMLFMDVALFVPNSRSGYFGSDDFGWPDLYDLLGMLHDPGKRDQFESRLERLKRKSLLEEVGDACGGVVMHDLWREFCVAETKAGKFSERRWIYSVERCTEPGKSSPSGSRWKNLERMYFMSGAGVQKFLGLPSDHFPNVKVLRVRDVSIARDPRFLDLGKMEYLKCLEIRHLRDGSKLEDSKLEIQVLGLESLTELAFLQWVGMPEEAGYAQAIERLTNLQFLQLPRYRGKTLPDMSKLTSLRSASFFSSVEVVMITGLTGELSNLQYLNLSYCMNLRSCPGVGTLVGLKSLRISMCWRLEELPDLDQLTNLRDLDMSRCSSLRVCPGLRGLRYLLKLNISFCSQLSKLPSLRDLVSLEELDARMCSSVSEFPDMRNLKKLEILYIAGCRVKTLPGFEALTALRELHASFELLEDRPALHKFTSLQDVSIGGWDGPGLMSIAKHAMLESLTVWNCEETKVELNLRNMERLQRLAFYDGQPEGILEDLRLAFYDGESQAVCATNAWQLEDVSVRDCGKLEVLDVVNIPGLQRLTVARCSLRRLIISAPVGAPRIVNRNGARDLERVSDLSGLQGLQELDVRECGDFTAFTSEEPLRGLKILVLSSCTSLVSLPDLSSFPDLESLKLFHCERLNGITSKEPLRALKILIIRRCTSLDAMPDLSYFPAVELLRLRRCKSLITITSKEPLRALKILKLRRCHGMDALPDLSSFPALESLHLCGCKSLISITSEERLRVLKILKLWRCHGIVELPDLSYFPALESLCLRDCRGLTSVHSDVPLCALETINLGGCVSVKHLSDLSNFLSLRRLDLEMCESLLSLTSSEPLPALYSLNAQGCRSLEALPDHLCSSVTLQYLGVEGSGIELTEDTVNELSASDVELESVNFFDWDEDRDWDSSDCDIPGCLYPNEESESESED